MIGRRVHIVSDLIDLKPGDYYRDKDGTWHVRTPATEAFPDGLLGNLRAHDIEEHEDGTITVSPSIGVRYLSSSTWDYHGFLKRGVWSDA